MTWTLFDVTYRVHQLLGGLVHGRATGGSTTTLIDSSLLSQYADDHFNKNGLGTVWILKDAGGAAAAPENEFSRVDDFISAQTTVSLLDTMTAAPASGDRYAIVDPRYSLDEITGEINNALDDLGFIVVEDTTSITTAANQTEHSLPVVNMDLRQVYYQQLTTDSNDNRWREVRSFAIEKNAAGTADLLITPYQLPSGRLLKLVYLGAHAEVFVSTDKIDEQIDIRLLAAQTAMRLLRKRLYRIGKSNDPKLPDQIRDMQAQVQEAEGRSRKMRRPARKPNIVITRPDYSYDPDEPATP